LSLVATLLEGHSKIIPRVDDTLEAAVKASHCIVLYFYFGSIKSSTCQ